MNEIVSGIRAGIKVCNRINCVDNNNLKAAFISKAIFL